MSDIKSQSLSFNATSRANDSTLADDDDSTFARELSSFLAELTTTTNMSSLEGSLARLKLAMIEEVQRNKQEEEEGKDGQKLSLTLDYNLLLQILTPVPPWPALGEPRPPRTCP